MKQMNVTQADLARAIGEHSHKVWYWYQGKYKPRYESMKKIADLLDDSVDNLFY